jgi:hypothetical protein
MLISSGELYIAASFACAPGRLQSLFLDHHLRTGGTGDDHQTDQGGRRPACKFPLSPQGAFKSSRHARQCDRAERQRSRGSPEAKRSVSEYRAMRTQRIGKKHDQQPASAVAIPIRLSDLKTRMTSRSHHGALHTNAMETTMLSMKQPHKKRRGLARLTSARKFFTFISSAKGRIQSAERAVPTFSSTIRRIFFPA